MAGDRPSIPPGVPEPIAILITNCWTHLVKDRLPLPVLTKTVTNMVENVYNIRGLTRTVIDLPEGFARSCDELFGAAVRAGGQASSGKGTAEAMVMTASVGAMPTFEEDGDDGDD